jgi:hypothetical protein
MDSVLTTERNQCYRQTDIYSFLRYFFSAFVRLFAVLFGPAVSPTEGNLKKLLHLPGVKTIDHLSFGTSREV